MEALRGDGTVFWQKGSRFPWIQYYVAGERVRESTKIDPFKVGGKDKAEKLAHKALRKKLSEIDTGEFSAGIKTRISHLYESLERDYTINGRKDLRNAKSRWKHHLEPFFGNKQVAQVNADTISHYIAHRQSQEDKPSNASINRELSQIKRMYKLAVKTGQLKVGQQPYVQMLKERNVRKGFLKDEEYQALARETAKQGLWLRGMFEIAYTYGWRRSELIGKQGLRVNQVDISKREILLNPGETKNELGRGAPMTDKVLELMVACISGKKSTDYVFTREKDASGRKPKKGYICDYRDAWDKATEAAGVSGLLFHDLRRTGVRNMRRHGISEKVAMTISGHKTRSVFERYNIIDPTDIFDAGAKLNQASKDRDQHVTLLAQQQMSFPPSSQKPN